MRTHKMEYCVVIGDSCDDMQKEVEKKLCDGWKLQAGVSTAFIPDEPKQNYKEGLYYVQAMTRKTYSTK